MQRLSKIFDCRTLTPLDSVPEFAQQELYDIWKEYRKGKLYKNELADTRNLLTVLAIFDNQLSSSENTAYKNPEILVRRVDNDDARMSYSNSDKRNPRMAFGSNLPIWNPDDDFDNSILDRSTVDPIHRNWLQQTTTTTTEVYAPFQHSRHEYNSPISECGETNNAVEETSATAETISQKYDFLNGASTEVINEFLKVWNDDDIPSESLRDEKIHRLAVSLLDEQQLLAYNAYATRKRLRARVHAQMQNVKALSNDARHALKALIRAAPSQRPKVLSLLFSSAIVSTV
uniref:Uncharacterized protein n=1 Tax=Syphacia muris TaxID=451379 RepID=A0A0N5AHZ5_9BILA